MRGLDSSASEQGPAAGFLSRDALTNPDVLNSNSVYQTAAIWWCYRNHGNPGVTQSQTKLHHNHGTPDVTSFRDKIGERLWNYFSKTTPVHGVMPRNGQKFDHSSVFYNTSNGDGVAWSYIKGSLDWPALRREFTRAD